MYYGMTYNEFRERSNKKIFENIENIFDDEYTALGFANSRWLTENEYQGEYNRLLVIVDSSDTEKVAFFEFTHFNVCENFVNKRSKIIWSNDVDKIWNGDGKMM